MTGAKRMIPPETGKGGTTVVSARLPKARMEDLDVAVAKTGRTRNEIIAKCLASAMEHPATDSGIEKGA